MNMTLVIWGLIIIGIGSGMTIVGANWDKFCGKEVLMEKRKQEQKLKNVDVKQAVEDVDNIKGVDIDRQEGTIEIDGLKVQQDAKNVKNMTGVSLKSGGEPGSIVAKGSWDIQQQTPIGNVGVQVNPTNSPNVHVEFGKVEIKKKEDIEKD